MSILIKGMEMPKSCYKCQMRRRDGTDIVCPVARERFSVTDVNILDYRLDNCPLIFVPPHGRLADADRLGFAMMDAANADQAMAMVDDAPTIIEAEEGEHEV